MIRFDAFGQSVSDFFKVAWSAAPSMQSLQLIFNRENFQALFTRAVGACSALISSPPKLSDFQNPRVVVITSVTVVVLFVVKKVRGNSTRSEPVVIIDKGLGFKDLFKAYEPIIKKDAQTLAFADFVAKHGEQVINILDEPTKNLLCRPSGPVIEEVPPEEVSSETVVATQPVSPSTRANALALHLKRANGNVRLLIAIFDWKTLASVTDPEGKEYISKIIEDGVHKETITYPQLRPLLNLQVLETLDPDSSEMQLFRKLFLSFPGRYTNFYAEDRRVFGCEANLCALLYQVYQERKISSNDSTAVS